MYADLHRTPCWLTFCIHLNTCNIFLPIAACAACICTFFRVFVQWSVVVDLKHTFLWIIYSFTRFGLLFIHNTSLSWSWLSIFGFFIFCWLLAAVYAAYLMQLKNGQNSSQYIMCYWHENGIYAEIPRKQQNEIFIEYSGLN